jgi:PEP-CTERM motif
VFYSTTPVSGAAGTGAIPAGMLASGSGAPSTYNISGLMGNSVTGPGYFASAVNNFTLSSGGPTVYFDVAVFQTGSSYANSTIRGQSGVFTGTLATGLTQPTYAQFGSFTIASVPEPTTLALAGLGGLASLVALRRKQA